MSATVKDFNDEPNLDKKVIPELMIPSFETSLTEDSSECNTAAIKPIISPDSNAVHNSISTTEASTTMSSSPPSPSQFPPNDDLAETSPANPSAPLSSPSQRPKPPYSHTLTSTSVSQPPKSATVASDKSDSALKNLNAPPAPVSISQRGRVVSLDRGGYNLNSAEYHDDDDEDDEDDDISTSSIGSSDGEGSYFSEHLPSPPRRRESTGQSNPRLLPPGGGGGNRNVPISSMYSRQYSASNESDLSLSSSSCEDNVPSQNVNLPNPYPITRTKSAPVKGARILPRNSRNEHFDLSYHSEVSNNRDKLNVIGLSSDEFPVPKNARQFPSTSSLVSSSSEDVERKNVKPSKHRRQSSYRSVGSITSAGSACLPEKPRRMSSDSDYIDVPSKPPELVSFSGGSDSSKHSRSSLTRKTVSDHRIPVNKSYNDPQQGFQVATLSDDQMNAWRSGGGINRSESYFSSNASGTDISPERPSQNIYENASVGKNSNHSQASRSGSGIFIYSEDDTDESSVKYKMSSSSDLRAMIESGHSETLISQGQSLNTRNRSFGKDLTNAEEIETIPRNAQINPIPDRRAQKLYETASGSMSSSNNPSSLRTNSEMYNKDSETYSTMTSRPSGFKAYWRRWLMLLYMSLLNLLSDWTCFSVAPIALLTKETFQIANPEHLVTIFLFANTVSTATEPFLLARLGLRKTIVFGSFLLMCGNVIKSAGIPGFIGSGIVDETDAWRLFVGFFLVGLSQPLYQCTPSILSSSWFPEKERTLATGVALNSNQLGIGCSFIFGSLLVVTSDDISDYFGFLSLLSTIVFIGCYMQFQDAPPTPPSETARVMKGNMMFPYLNNMHHTIPQYFRRFQGPMVHAPTDPYDDIQHSQGRGSSCSNESRGNRNRAESEGHTVGSRSTRRSKRSDYQVRGSPTNAFRSSARRPRKGSSGSKSRSSQRSHRSTGSRTMKSDTTSRSRRRENVRGLAPSPSLGTESTAFVAAVMRSIEREADNYGTVAPSSMMSGHSGYPGRIDGESDYYDTPRRNSEHRYQQVHQYTPYTSGPPIPMNQRQFPNYNGQQPTFADQVDGIPDTPFANLRHMNVPMSGSMPHSQHYPHVIPYDYRGAPINYYPPHFDPRYMYQQAPMQPGPYHNIHHDHHFGAGQTPNAPYMYENSNNSLPSQDRDDEGVEPVLTHAGSSLSIDISDDQLLRSIKACFSRKGFTQTVIAFAVSGIVLNTISTYMDSLLSPSGAGRGFVGLIGGLFQALVMISSMIIGKITDRRRAYYSVIIILLLLGAFTLAECAINLEAERGSSLKWTLLILAVFVGPLQPVATELGVEVVYPLSENTVLVVQQLLSNLTSAIFIPFFHGARNFALEGADFERPQYTFSFWVLMATHVLATIFFSTFRGSYKRYEHEQRRKSNLTDNSLKNNEDVEANYLVEEKQTLL